jgi:hypothetical protein
MAKDLLPQEYEVALDQLMTEYLKGYKPAVSFAEADRTFTTQQVFEQVIAMYPSAMITELTIYSYLQGEEYAPKLVGDELLWCAKKG